MKILLVDNQFDGAYGSLTQFINEISFELLRMNHKVFIAKNMEDAMIVYKTQSIDFSIGIGRYPYYIQGRALYSIYQVIHYQWIIDNPYKMQIDNKSEYIRYILIDKLFLDCIDSVKNKELVLPLGIPYDITVADTESRLPGIVFAGQIRDVNEIYAEIMSNRLRSRILQIIDILLQRLDEPFISVFNREAIDLNYEDKIQAFKLCNSYLRAYKRTKVITEIKNYPVYIIGDSNKQVEQQGNVVFLGKSKYANVFEIMKKYRFALNIEPNFNTGFHDRALRAICNGNALITNYGMGQKRVYGENAILYKYSDINDIVDSIIHMSLEDIRNSNEIVSKRVRKYFGWNSILSQIIKDFRSR